MQPQYHVRLRILDEEISPEQITEQIGVYPSKTWHKNDIRPKTSIKEKENGWELESTLPKESLLTEHVECLLSIMKPVHCQFQSYSQKYYCEISCTIYFEEERPVVSLDKNLIRQLAELNLNLDIDIYSI